MDRDRARRLLADVINLTDNRSEAESSLAYLEARADRVREAAERRVAAVEEAIRRLAGRLADADKRLEAARAAIADVPPGLAEEVLTELASERVSKQAFLDALAATPITAPTGDEVAALAEAAGITIATAGSAGAAGAGGRV